MQRPRPLALAPLLAPLLLLAGCGADRAEERQKLALHREFASKYFEEGQLLQAENQVDLGLEIDSSDDKLRLMKAWIRQKRGSPEDVLTAEALFREIVPAGDFRAMLGLGQALERKGVMYWESAGPVERGERETRAADPAKRGEELRKLAQAAWKDSIRWYEATLEAKPGYLEAVNGLQRVCGLIGDLDKSLEWSNELLEQGSRETDFWRAELARPDLRAVEEQEYRKLLGASAKLLIETHLAASTTLVQLGRGDEALPHLDSAAALDPERAEIYSRRAQLHKDAGRLSEAREDIQRFLRLSMLPVEHPDMRRAYDLLEECELARQR
jgi:tetratricopeptide (TPR) repeat protein